VPAASFLYAARGVQRLVAVGVSVSAPGLDGPAAETVRCLQESLDGVPVLVGGWAISGADHATALGADGWAADGGGAVALIEGFADRPG
jgi:methanogenic corrinoid protein MtbC1